jgi:hypothetical protein
MVGILIKQWENFTFNMSVVGIKAEECLKLCLLVEIMLKPLQNSALD